jgi:hypothetical protein|tara:strand:+ start:6241 stop:7341 length:1101 start_codon:yes stop_codon:yes gene_type:complete
MATQQQDPQMAADAINRIASNQLGVPTQQAQTQQPAPPASQPQAPKAPPKDSAAEQAASKGSPDTEGDKMSAEAIIYEIDFGDMDKEGNKKKRELTPNQIKSTFERYSALNHKNAVYKPITDVIDQYMRTNPGVSTKQIAEQLANISKAGESNPTMGNTKGDKPGVYEKDTALKSGDVEASLKKWEEDNAVTLPPGFRDMMNMSAQGNSNVGAMQQELAQVKNMLRQVVAQSAGMADAAKAGFQTGENAQISAAKQTIANNLDRVQQALGLADGDAQEFQMFAAERGYTMEDFADPQLTIKVMTDYKNNKSSPEMARLRDIMGKRQAFTGSVGQTANADVGAGASEQSSPSTFDRFTNNVMTQKGY